MKTLLVSNTPDSLTDTKALLEQKGHEVVVAQDGVKAWIELCDAFTPFQIVISDWLLATPLDAFGLCKKIRSAPFSSNTYIIMSTNRTDSADLEAGIQAGADDFIIAEPFDVETLESKLRLAERVLGLQKTISDKDTIIKALNTKLEQQSTKDKLTGLYNRRAFHRSLEEKIRLARRMEQPISLLMLDLDNFKAIKKEHGPVSGDGVVQLIRNILREHTRTSDFVARFGGEKFGVILPCTHKEGSMICAEGLRKAANNLFWESQQITISIGAATIDQENYNSEAVSDLHTLLLSESDQALYQSQNAGPNHINHFTVSDSEETVVF